MRMLRASLSLPKTHDDLANGLDLGELQTIVNRKELFAPTLVMA